MRLITLFFIVLCCVACERNICPDKVLLSPCMEWEIQHGQPVKHKPKVMMNLNWDLNN